MSSHRLLVTLCLLLALPAACSTGPATFEEGSTGEPPAWVEEVVPEPGAVATVPDAVEVDHTITATDEDVRLLINGVDVTTYATFEAGKIRYEAGDGPVDLGTGDHTAEVQRVTLPSEGVDFTVIDSYTWRFRLG